MTDQQRNDVLGIAGHPVLQTPAMDWIGTSGTWFRRGYSEAPTCIPARRVLMSGQAPSVNGMVGMQSRLEWDPPATLAGELGSYGYETRMIGVLHLHPRRKRYGFDAMELSDINTRRAGIQVGESAAEAHPPGVGQPQKRGTIALLQVAPVGRHSNRAMP